MDLARFSSYIAGVNKLNLRKRIGWNFIVNFLGAIIAFALNLMLARILGVSVYGEYIYVLSWISIFVLIGKYGLDTAALRFIPAYRVNDDYGKIKGFIKRSSQLLIAVSLIISLIIMSVVMFLDNDMGGHLESAFIVSAILLPVYSFFIFRCALLQSYNMTAYGQAIQLIARPIIFASMIVLLWYFSPALESINSSDVLATYTLAVVIGVVIAIVLFKQKQDKQYQSAVTQYESMLWFKAATPLLFLTGFNMLINQTDIIMIGAMIGTDEAGVYAIVVRVCQFITFMMIASNAVAAPLISQLYSQNKTHELQRMVTIVTWVNTVFALMVFAAIIIFDEFVLGLFGSEFVAGDEYVLIIALSKISLAVTGISGYLMSMSGHQKEAAIVMGFSSISNILLNYILISNYGAYGAAVASLITVVLWNVWMVLLVRKYIGINSTAFIRATVNEC